MSHQKDEVSDLVFLHALVAQMRLLASRPVVDAVESAMERIIEAYLAPNSSLHEIKDLARSGAMNFLLDFGELVDWNWREGSDLSDDLRVVLPHFSRAPRISSGQKLSCAELSYIVNLSVAVSL